MSQQMHSHYLNEVLLLSVVTVLCFLTISPDLLGVGIHAQTQNSFLQLSMSDPAHSSSSLDFHLSDMSVQNHDEPRGEQHTYEPLAGVPINCSRTIPPGARALMRSIAFDKSNESAASNQQQRGSKKQMHLRIPDEYLHNCLRAYPYNVAQFPLGFTNRRMDIWYHFGVVKVMSLDYEGKLEVKVTIAFDWQDFYRMWLLNASDLGVGNWKFRDFVFVPSEEVWHPVFELAQCENPPCYIKPDNLTYVMIKHNGSATFQQEFSIQAACDVEMDEFPFDYQKCNLTFLLSRDDFFNTVRLNAFNDVYLRTLEDAEEWHLVKFTHSVHYHGLTHYEYNGSIWRQTKAKLNYKIPAFKANLVLKRHSQYYVFILIVPVMVMTFCNFFSVILPSNSDSKLEFLASVLNGFIFIQTVLATLLPRVNKLPPIANYVVLSLALCLFNTVGCMFVVSAASFGEHSSQPPRILSLIFIDSACTIARVCCWIVSKVRPCCHSAQSDKARLKATSNRVIHSNLKLINHNNEPFRDDCSPKQKSEIELAFMPPSCDPQVVAIHDTLYTIPPASSTADATFNTHYERNCTVSPNRSTENQQRNNNLNTSRTSNDPFSQPRLERLPPRNQRMTAFDRTLHNCGGGFPNQMSLFEFTERPDSGNEKWLATSNGTDPVDALHSSYNAISSNELLSTSTQRSPSNNFSTPTDTAQNLSAEKRGRNEEDEEKKAEPKHDDTANDSVGDDDEEDPHAKHVSWSVLARNLNILVSLCYVVGNVYALSYIAPLMHAWQTDPEECWLLDGC